jgi:hypothetical protein
MTPFWRRPGALMSAYFVLVLATGPWSSQSTLLTVRHPAGAITLPAIAIAAFLAWRVTRGSRVARGTLVLWTVAGFAALVRSPAMHSGSLVPFWLLVAYTGQIALLLSEPVYNRTRKKWAGEPLTQPTRLWPAPPAWMLPAALAAGALLALATLGSMSFKPVPGCQAPGYLAPHSARLASCYTLTQGYPVPYLTALPSLSLNRGSKVTASNLDLFANAVISKRALVEDLATWTLASATGLFVIWIPRRRPEPSPATAQAVPA